MGTGWHGSSENYLGRRTLPQLVHTSNLNGKVKPRLQSKSFLPKVVQDKQTNNISFLDELLTTRALQPTTQKEHIFNVRR